MGGARRLGGSIPGRGGAAPVPGKDGNMLGGNPGRPGAMPGYGG